MFPLTTRTFASTGKSLGAGKAMAGAELIVRQRNKTFQPDELRAKVKDRPVFLNDNDFAHNVYSESPGFEFSIPMQQPGESDAVSLEKPGEFTVECVIHPRMKLTVIVE